MIFIPARKLMSAALLGTTVLAGVAFSQPVLAQQTADARSYAIKAGPLARVLAQFADESGIQISYEADLTNGKTSAGLSGRFTQNEALTRILSGTRLVARQTDANAVTIAAATTGRLELDPMRVEGEVPASGVQTADAAEEGANSSSIVVVGATQTIGMDLSLRETPQSVTVIDSERMQEQALFDISQVMEQVVGIQSNRSSALGTDGTNYTARGFAIENYLVDGIMRPTGLYGFTEDTADMIAYDRIEVLRGSAGMMTGTGQPSAAINMIRKRPGAATRASAAATVGSWDLYRLEADLGGAVTSDGRVRARVAGAWQDNHTFVDREHIKRQALYGVVEADLTPTTLLSAGIEYQNFTNSGASRGGIPLYYTDGTRTDLPRSSNGGAKWSHFQRKSVNVFASLKQELGSDWTLQIDGEHKSGSYDESIGYFWGGKIDRETGLGGTLYSTRWASDLTMNAVYANLRGSFEMLGQDQHIAVTVNHAQFDDEQGAFPGWWNGGEYMITSFNAFDLFETGDVPQPDLSPTGGGTGNRVRTTGLSGVARLKPVSALSVILGGRFTWWKQDTYDEDTSGLRTWTTETDEKGVFIPYAGLVFDVTKSLSAYVSYASVFEPQTYQTVDGDMLAPLEGNTYEAGLKTSLFNGRLTATAAVFKMQQDNYAIADGAGIYAPNGSLAYHAVSGLKSSGVEFEVNGEVLPGWRVAGGFANARSEDRDGLRQMPQIAKNSFKMFTSYQLPGDLSGLTLGGNMRWQGKTRTETLAGNGDYYTQGSLAIVDLMANYRFSENLSLAVHLDNVFDKTYFSGLYANGARYGAPRGFNVTLRGTL